MDAPVSQKRWRLSQADIVISTGVGLAAGMPVSAWILYNIGALVKASSVVVIVLFAPGALLLTHSIVAGALGIAAYFTVQFIWWTGWTMLIRKLAYGT